MKDLNPWTLPLSGTSLIEASAGTGKTFTLTTLYLRLLVEKDLLPSQILVVTYTQAATAELRERVRGRIREAIAAGEEEEGVAAEDEMKAALQKLGRAARQQAEGGRGIDPLRRALQEFDEAAIFTIHGFCQRVLARNAFESGVAFDAELEEAPNLLDQTLAHDLWANALAEEDPDFVRWLLAGPGKRWEFEPKALQSKLLSKLGADEEMPIEAESEPLAGAADPAALRSAMNDALQAWAARWTAERSIVVDWMLEGGALNGNSYRLRTIAEQWLPVLDALAATWQEDPIAAAQSDFELPAWWDKWSQESISSKVKKGKVALEHPLFADMGKVLEQSRALNCIYEERALGLRRSFVEGARKQALRRREEQHLLFFDDLLSELRGALRPPGGDRLTALLREQYPFALIDEFQDTDPVQYEIFRRVWHRASGEGGGKDEGEVPGGLILIGDPKQAIYSFRGADLFTYLSAREDAGDARYCLGTNWRSDPGLIHVLNELFARPASAFGLDEISFSPVKPQREARCGLQTGARSAAGLRVLMGDRGALADHRSQTLGSMEELSADKPMPIREARTELMRAFAQDVADLLSSGATIDGRPIRPSDIAVLAQKKRQLAGAREALEAMGIPCVDRGDADVFESREAWELLSVLRAVIRAGDPDRLRAALSTGAMGRDAADLAGLLDDSVELAEASERFAEYARLWSQAGFMRAFESWRRREGVTPRLLALKDGDRRLTNWLHLAELLQRIETERAVSRSGLVDWLERAIADPEARRALGSEASLLRLERDDQAVCLMTLHRSKGLEFEVVYLPALWEQEVQGASETEKSADAKRNPPVRCFDPDRGQRILDLGGRRYAEHVAREKEERASEQRRLLYVGLTRAKRQCVVVWAVAQSTAKTSLAELLFEPEWEAGSEGGRESEAEKPENGAKAKTKTKTKATKKKATKTDRMKALGEEDWRGLWNRLGDAGPKRDEMVSVEAASFGFRKPWQAPQPEMAPLMFTPPVRAFPAPRVTTSFSGLVQGAHRGVGAAIGPVALGRDLDSGVDSGIDAGIEDLVSAPDLEGGMDRFPRGAEAGTLLHQVLEEVCLSDWDETETRGLARRALERAGFPLEFEASVMHVVRAAAQTPLRREPNVLRLGDLPRSAFLPEMEFTIAVPGEAKESGEVGRGGLRPETLATLLESAPGESALARYAPRLRELSWRALRGYLRGFIDGIFFDGERYFLLDYKSNDLGPHQADYRPDRLIAPMIEHDYILQYLIYSVALHRHLKRSLLAYDFDQHFGGVYYLFLRGFSPGHEPDCGVFFDRPERALLESISALLGEAPDE